jgi:predicted metalloprotease
MDLSGQRESGNVQDARGGKAGLAVGGGVVALLIALVAGYFGIDPQLAQQIGGGLGNRTEDGPGKEDGYKKFSARVLGSTEDVWAAQFQEEGYGQYRPVKMKLFSEGVETGPCGFAPSAVGPFYCSGSDGGRGQVFLDPTFFDELEQKLGGSKAEFSQAYVIAHEVGHHVQHLLGYDRRLEEFSGEGKNAGIRLELQADYLAGVWAHHARQKLKISEADMRAALQTARQIGDNRIQEKVKGRSWPESFTHGSDTQRQKWFLDGFKTGDASKRKLNVFFNPRTRPLDL